MRKRSYADDANRKLSHLRDLQRRLAEAEFSVADLVASIPPELAKTESRRANGRILKHNERIHERSEAMLNLPYDRLYGVALSGMWSAFPVSPEAYYKRLRARFNWRHFHEERESWALAKILNTETEAANSLADQGKAAEAFAMLRSVMSVAIELTCSNC